MDRRYRVDLLDDLDTHFPDLLYNQSRFRTIGDVLDYVYEGAIQANEDYYLERVRGQRRINLDVLREAGDLGEGQDEDDEETEEEDAEEEDAEEDVVSQVLIRFREEEEDEQNDERPRQRPRLETFVSGGATADQPSFLQSLLIMPVRQAREINRVQQTLREFFEPVPVVPTAEQIESSSTIYTYAEEDEDHNCPICQDSITLGESIRTLNHCHHFFHQGCIDAWLESSVRCPLCRHDIRS